MPSLDDWEKQWQENPQKIAKPAVVQVDFRAQDATGAGTENHSPVGAAGQMG